MGSGRGNGVEDLAKSPRACLSLCRGTVGRAHRSCFSGILGLSPSCWGSLVTSRKNRWASLWEIKHWQVQGYLLKEEKTEKIEENIITTASAWQYLELLSWPSRHSICYGYTVCAWCVHCLLGCYSPLKRKQFLRFTQVLHYRAHPEPQFPLAGRPGYRTLYIPVCQWVMQEMSMWRDEGKKNMAQELKMKFASAGGWGSQSASSQKPVRRKFELQFWAFNPQWRWTAPRV